MKIVVYTAIVPSEFDKLGPAMYPSEDVKYICFTDDPDKIDYWGVAKDYKNWEIRKIEREYDDPGRDAKKVKALCHKFVEADVSIYTDANIMFYKNPIEGTILRFVELYDLALHIHPLYTNIYVEGAVVLARDKPNLVANQLVKYKEEGFSGSLEGQVPMFAGGFIIRKHTKLIEEFNTNWWNEIVNHSKRDQLSLNYTIWKMGFKCNPIPWLSLCGPIYHHSITEKSSGK
jgi:hypothetical protein